MILGIILALGIAGGFIIGFPLFVIWVAHEHTQAKKFRYLMLLASQQKPATVGPQWTVTYRDKGRVKTIVAGGATESDLYRGLIKDHGIGFDKIVSSTKL